MDTESRIRGIIQEINTISRDQVTGNPQQLWNWGVQLGAELTFLATEMVDARRGYALILLTKRQEQKTKADAEIYAMTSPEWQRYEQIKQLHESGKEMLMVVKKFINVMESERRTMHY